MRILDTLVRWGKLGLFVGWGAGLAVWGACSSSPAPAPDASGDLKRPPEARASDAAPDRSSRDAGAGERARDAVAKDQKPVDTRAWDVPLE